MPENRIPLIVAGGMTLVLTLFAVQVPFLWDGVYHSLVAGIFLDTGFNGGMPPAGISNGNPTLYPALLVAAWALFGKSLALTHVLFAGIILFTVAGFIRLASLVARPVHVLPALLLLFLDPGFLAQCMLMGYDILMLGLVLWGIWAVITGQRLLLVLFSSMLVLTHMRGLSGVAILLLTILLTHRDGNRQGLQLYLMLLPAGIVLAGWMVLHHASQGFFMVSPGNAGFLGELSFGQWLRNTGYALWKTLDLGRAGLWFSAALLVHASRKRLDDTDRMLILLALAPLALHILAFSGTMLPVSHRYFIAGQAFVILLIARLFRFVPRPRVRALTVVLALILLSGNLWFYPQRFGNAWDSSLIFLAWPGAERELRSHLDERGIPAGEVMSEYPLTYRHSDMYLDADTTAFTQYEPDLVRPGSRVLFTNFSNRFDPTSFDAASGWRPEWETQRGRVTVALLVYDP